MSLLISIVKAPDSIVVTVPSMSFDAQGGTLGRAEDNSWVLDDPELYLSSLHCEICFENGQYYLIDRSTNGTFYNGSVDPMGKGSRLPVNNNDRFIIGDYEFSINVQDQPVNMGLANDPFSSPAEGMPSSIPGDSLFGSAAPLENFAGSPFDSGHSPGSDPLFNANTGDADPLAALDKARGGAAAGSNDLFSMPTHSDGASPLNQQVDWPEPIPRGGNVSQNVIPDDWNLDTEEPVQAIPQAPIVPAPPPVAPIAAGPSAKERVLATINQKLMAEVEALKQQINSKPAATVSSGSVDATFINALGFADRNLSDSEISKINHLAGEVMREMVAGLMQVLGSRSAIKNEFRMNVTTIQPVENNPLKFSANVDDALENMFLKQGNAFKQPLDAVREGFDGVAEHQVAILAGIREAFKAVIERFDPITLEERFGKQRSGILPGSHKAKNWEAYVDYYNELAGDIDKSFQYLFGDGFVRAYEDQLQKLAISKKSRIKK